MRPCVDQQLVVRQLTEKIERTADARRRRMLERVREHAAAETTGDLDGLMRTLSPAPAYHFWELQGDTGPKGRDGVAAFYADFVQRGLYFLEVDCERIVADEDCVVLEAVLKAVFPGEAILENPMAAGMDIDRRGHYLLTVRNVTFWPFDENEMIVGEDSYTGGPVSLRRLDEEELPEGYKALFAEPVPE